MLHLRSFPLRRVLALLFLGVLAILCVWFVGPREALPVAKAAVLCVNPGGTGGCFARLNAAIAAATAGDTINVAAGVYEEQVVVNKPSLVLRGAQAGVPACGRAGASGETVLRQANGPVQITADGVTLDGFTIQGGVSGLSAGITTSADGAGYRLRNNIIQNNAQGIYLNSNGTTATLVQGNSFRHDPAAGARAVNGIYSDVGLRNVTLTQNCFAGQGNASIVISGSVTRDPERFSGLSITNNTATGEQFLELLFTKNVTISGNRISNAPPSSDPQVSGTAISLGGGNVGVTLEANTILNTNRESQNNAPAIMVRDPYGVAALNREVTVHCNRIVGNLAGGLVVQTGTYEGTVKAENNWWGCNAGPGGTGCDTVSAGADATPWLVLGLSVPATSIQDAATPLSAAFTRNSAGALAACPIPDDTEVKFASTCGTPNPATALTAQGEAKATLNPSSLGACTVTATADKQTLSAALTVMEGPAVTVTPLNAGCLGPGDKLNIAMQITNTTASAQTVTINSTLPPQLRALPGCPAALGTCTITNETTVNYSATLAPGQKGSFSLLAMVGDEVSTGNDLCLTTTSTLGGMSKSVTNCVKVTCEMLGPGRQFTSPLAGGAQQPGSVLIYNLYTSAAAAPNAQDTRFNLTNTSTTSAATVHLFFISTGCQVADAFVCLTANQTTSFLASDLDPGTNGYVVAVAVNRQTGCPVPFNHLIGDEFVKMTSGHQANLGAEAILALSDTASSCVSNGVTATLRFDGFFYGLLPAQIAFDSVPSRADGNETLWVINRLDGNLATGTFAPAVLTGLLYDDVEQPYGIRGYTVDCQLSGQLLRNATPSPLLVPFERAVPAGRTGWLKLYLNSTGTLPGLLGALLNYNPRTRTNASAFNQGRLAHKLTLTNATVLTIPVTPPLC